MMMTLADIRWCIHSPLYINYDETKIICRECGKEFDIDNIEEDFFLNHSVEDIGRKFKELSQIFEEQG